LPDVVSVAPDEDAVIYGGRVVTELLAALGAPVPAPLVAVTVNVYDVFDVNPLTVTGEEAAVPVIPPGLDVAV
jgi:hypothetical protein